MISYKSFLCILLGNIKLDGISPKKLRKRYICSEHFDKAMYMNSTCVKPRLIKNAVPKIFSNGKEV